MNFGHCPYCDQFMGMFPVPDVTPVYAIVQCERCGKDTWYRFSRLDPQCWTIEDFEEAFTIDEEARTITPKAELELGVG